MFGFAVAKKELLSAEQRGLLNVSYCGLCKALREGFGPWAGVAANYDALFLILLIVAQRHRSFRLGDSTRCPATGFLKKRTVLEDQDACDYASAVTFLLLDEKLKDRRRDRSSMAATVTCVALNPCVRRAYGTLSSLSFPIELIADSREKQRAIEMCRHQEEMQNVLAPTGKIVGQVFAHTARIAGRPENEETLYHLGYSIGRIVALADACEDLRSDRVRKVYNPFLVTSAVEPDSYLPVEIFAQACHIFALEFSDIKRHLANLQLARFHEVVDNVVTKGVPYRTKQALRSLWCANHWRGRVPNVMNIDRRFRACSKCGAFHIPSKREPTRDHSRRQTRGLSRNLWLLGTLVSSMTDVAIQTGFRDAREYLMACTLSALAHDFDSH